MRSGGLRGLQILRSGVSDVRGGFDSHAFPPLPGAAARAGAARVPARAATMLAVMLLLLLAGGRGLAHAQTPIHTGVSPDSINVDLSAMDSLGTLREAPAPPDTGRHLHHTRPRGKYDAPVWVMMRSLVFPGWGQAHNKAWFKAAAVAAGEGYLIARLVQDEQALSGLRGDIDAAHAAGDDAAEAAAVDAYNARLSDSNARKWWLGAVLAYALLDAYVDAHFVDFGVEFGGSDPALPGGAPDVGAKLKVRWHF